MWVDWADNTLSRMRERDGEGVCGRQISEPSVTKSLCLVNLTHVDGAVDRQSSGGCGNKCMWFNPYVTEGRAPHLSNSGPSSNHMPGAPEELHDKSWV